MDGKLKPEHEIAHKNKAPNMHSKDGEGRVNRVVIVATAVWQFTVSPQVRETKSDVCSLPVLSALLRPRMAISRVKCTL